MKDIVISLKDGKLKSVRIDGEEISKIYNAIVDFNFPNKPILTLYRFKADSEGILAEDDGSPMRIAEVYYAKNLNVIEC